jgi:cellulose synthase/poly-beta-1,6-N-acetylglucosamine synthase-like glycosyltransferase
MAYNEASNIGNLLDKLLNQSTQTADIEKIIIVTSGCTDCTDEIVEQFVSRDNRVQLLRQAQREGKASAVNLFMNNARSAEVIIMISADVLPNPNTIEALISPYADPRVGMVGGHPVPTNPKNTFIGFAINLQWELLHAISLQHPKMGELISFRNIFHQIPLDTAVDEASIEPLIVGQGMRLHYAPEAIVYNRGPETLHDFIKQRRRIYAGHLYVKDTLGYQVATMNSIRILAVFFRNLKADWRYFIWAPFVFALELYVRFLGKYDYSIRKRKHCVWQMVETTKKDLAKLA